MSAATTLRYRPVLGWPEALGHLIAFCVAFALGWAAVRVGAWIVDGFLADRARSRRASS